MFKKAFLATMMLITGLVVIAHIADKYSPEDVAMWIKTTFLD